MIWKIKPQLDDAVTAALSVQLGTPTGAFPQALAMVLAQRGIKDLDAAKKFLLPSTDQLHDPFLMLGMEAACKRIATALEKKEGVLIYGDYDVDGTTSVSLLQLFFEDLGFEFETYVPNRFIEGYGISFEGIQYAADNGCSLVIALDCGTKAIDKVRFANEKGVDVIVVDHHQPGEELPAVAAMLNPLQPGCNYPDQSLSACALTMKLCQGLHQSLAGAPYCKALPEGYDPFLKYCDLVALSIACDIVPLQGENRTMLHFGMEKVRNHPLPGIEALKNLDDGSRDWTVSDLVFYMGPRINSAGRLKNATEAVALLTGKADNLGALAQSLNTFNEERKTMDKVITEHALSLIAEEEALQRRATTVLFHEDWSKGIIGIVASRLIERYHRPTILLTRSGGYFVGSGRSVPGFDLHQAIESCLELLVQFGGHKYAAGLTLREEDYPAFRQKFEEVVQATLQETSKVSELNIDTYLNLNQLDDRFMRLLRRLSPFGPSNPEPNFLAQKVKVLDVSILKKEHVRFLFEQNGVKLEGIGFFMAERWEAVNALLLDLVYQPDYKTWKGQTHIQLKVKDFQSSN
ncbi:MAG TPA: single-stranded-DNA-specific exonuclease RecJ [Bacteroidia bacterium]|nr:single-stranded-DNA-specific exonuclease RecJ [Bacteroidia bacterium]